MRTSRILPALIAASLLVGVNAAAQPRPTSGAEFPAARFDSLDRIAFYLWQYDSFAWATSDTLSSHVTELGNDLIGRLGEEWFCFKRDSTWHAVYGKYDPATDRYDAVLHYVSAGSNGIVRTSESVDSNMANRFGRALSITRAHLPSALQQSNIRFNSYLREREDGRVDVWYIPAWQQNGWILYGAEFQYTLDETARTVTDSIVRLGNIKGMRPDTTATLHLVHEDSPGIATVAELLFIRLYTRHFAHVRVITRDWSTELFKGPPQAWIHALREARPAN